MKFLVIEVNDGGAEHYMMTLREVDEYLSRHDEWAEAWNEFRNSFWPHGWAMSYPCGWIVRVLQGVFHDPHDGQLRFDESDGADLTGRSTMEEPETLPPVSSAPDTPASAPRTSEAHRAARVRRRR